MQKTGDFDASLRAAQDAADLRSRAQSLRSQATLRRQETIKFENAADDAERLHVLTISKAMALSATLTASVHGTASVQSEDRAPWQGITVRTFSAERLSSSADSIVRISDDGSCTGSSIAVALSIIGDGPINSEAVARAAEQMAIRNQVDADSAAALRAQAAAALADVQALIKGAEAMIVDVSNVEARAAVLEDEATNAHNRGDAMVATVAASKAEVLRKEAAGILATSKSMRTRASTLGVHASSVAAAADAAEAAVQSAKTAELGLSSMASMRWQEGMKKAKRDDAGAVAFREAALQKLLSLREVQQKATDLQSAATAARQAGDDAAALRLQLQAGEARACIYMIFFTSNLELYLEIAVC